MKSEILLVGAMLLGMVGGIVLAVVGGLTENAAMFQLGAGMITLILGAVFGQGVPNLVNAVKGLLRRKV